MNHKKILEELTKKNIEKIKRLKNLPIEERKLIEEKKIEIHKRVVEKLKENKISFTSIRTYFHEDHLQRDGITKKDVFTTSITEPLFGKSIFIFSDPETLDILYVQTEVTRFMDVDEFFKLRERP